MAKSIMQAAAPAPLLTRIRAWWRSRQVLADPIGELMSKRVGMVQRGEYEPLGTIIMLQTEAGWIQFPTRNGLALARFADGGLDLLDAWEWNGLPDRYEATNELCQECSKAPCPECFPEDEFGELSKKLMLRPGERPCTYGSQVECCGGTGVIACQDNAVCPSCGGTGKVRCRKCLGGAQASTGYMDWDNDLRGSPSGKFCASCGGSGRVRKIIQQPIGEHLCPTSARALPIAALMLSLPNHQTQPWKASPDGEGIWPHIISAFTPGARAMILGGVLRPEVRTRRRTNGD